MSAQALAAGPASVPSPLTDRDADWLFNYAMLNQVLGIEVAAGVFAPMARYRNWDLRAQRKLDMGNERVVLVVQNTSSITLARVTMSAQCFYKL